MRDDHQVVLAERGEQTGPENISEKSVPVQHTPEESKPAQTSWVREHSYRPEDFRRAFSDLLRKAGFRTS